MRLLAASLGGLILLIGAGSGGATTRDEPRIRPVAETISAGHSHACGVASRISLRCWGRNNRGQLGNGDVNQFGSNPLPRDVFAGAGSGIENSAAGGEHSCLVGNSGVRCWGQNGLGQLGTGDTLDRLQPAGAALGGDIRGIAAGGAHTCAVAGGGVRCWGANREGQLGNGQAGCDPQQDPFLDKCYRTRPVTVSGLGGVKQLSAGWHHTCALTTGGGVSCWGSNWLGQLGNGGPTSIDPETGIERGSNTPVAVTGLKNGVKAVSAGGDHTCAITNAGAIKCWGDNGFGQLGNGKAGCGDPEDICIRPTPVTVALRGAAAIAAGGQHTCAITTKGGVICWGRNTYGGLGDGTKRERHRPVAVSGLGLGSGVTEITAGYQYTCARLDKDDLRCWGRNDFGQLGDGTSASRTRPVATLFGCFERPPTIVAKPGKVTIGTQGDDVILGTNGPDFIRGDGGSDRICGFGGPDRIHVGRHDDGARVDGGQGADDIRGGDANDQLDGGAGDDSIEGGKGEDVIDAFESAGDDKLSGGEELDVLHGGEGIDVLLGGEGKDKLYGEEGGDTINGGSGDDLLVGLDGSDDLDGGADDDILNGGQDDDILAGGAGRDELDGYTGDDHLSGGGGTDNLYGRDGEDFLFGGSDRDFLFGNGDDDHLFGNGGGDILHGGPGTDRDDGGEGPDHCWGEIFRACVEVHKPG